MNICSVPPAEKAHAASDQIRGTGVSSGQSQGKALQFVYIFIFVMRVTTSGCVVFTVCVFCLPAQFKFKNSNRTAVMEEAIQLANLLDTVSSP